MKSDKVLLYCADCGEFIGDKYYWQRRSSLFLCGTCLVKKQRRDNSYMQKVFAEIGEEYVEVRNG